MNTATQRLFDECLEMTGGDRAAAAQLALADSLRSDRKSPTSDGPMTLPEVAAHLRVRREKVLEWVRSGELRAYNVAATAAGNRRKYRVESNDLKRFLERRQITPPATSGRPSRARQAPQFSRPVLDTAKSGCGRSRP